MQGQTCADVHHTQSSVPETPDPGGPAAIQATIFRLVENCGEPPTFQPSEYIIRTAFLGRWTHHPSRISPSIADKHVNWKPVAQCRKLVAVYAWTLGL